MHRAAGRSPASGGQRFRGCTFRATGIPEGLSELAIETSEGFFVVATPIAIAPGTTRRVQLAYGGRQDRANPLAASVIVVGSAIVLGFAIDELTQSDEEPASPS